MLSGCAWMLAVAVGVVVSAAGRIEARHTPTTPPDPESMFDELEAPPRIQSGLPLQAVNSDQDVMKYLMQYGYIGKDSDDPRTSNIQDADAVRQALWKFQQMAGIPQTGEMDAATREMMALPRCGVKDADKGRRMKRYVLEGSKWDDIGLTYRINSFTEDLPKAKVKAIFHRAFKEWSAVSPLTFTKKQLGSVDIEIEFGVGDHGDAFAFDGPGKTLAHAFFPAYGGDAHFDDAEAFTDNGHDGINLFQVAVHEFGHSLGLSHSDEKQALMYPIYRGYVADFKLHEDDINAIQALYGKPQEPTTPSLPVAGSTEKGVTVGPTTLPPTPVTSPPGGCKARFDAVTSFTLPYTDKYITLAFSGEHYYILTTTKVITRKTLTDFKHLDRVDGAITKTQFSRVLLYLFRAQTIYVYSIRNHGPSLRIQSTKTPSVPISLLVHGLPDNIDAIFTWMGNNKVYAFKGRKYYRLSGRQVAPGYPRAISAWGLPDSVASVDAVMQHNKRTFFFIGEDYYRIDDRTLTVVEGYPRNIGQAWLRCAASHMSFQPTETSGIMPENDGIVRIKTAFQNEQASGTSSVTTTTSVLVMVLVNACISSY